MLSVEDNGPGIPPDVLPHIFDRYFTTKEQDYRRDNQGLGLWHAKRFVEAAGGSIEAGPSPDGGAAFRIVLPACAENAEAEEIVL